MGFVYDPEIQLPQLFPNEDSLSNIGEVLEYISKQKSAANAELARQVKIYQSPITVSPDVSEVARSLTDMRKNALAAHSNILKVTSQIQKLDTTKNNLVLSMKVLKRLQMLISAFSNLTEVIKGHDYEEIATHLGAVRGLMEFFKPYKSIDEIAALNQRIHQTQNKLVDDIFIDFEDSFTNHITNDKLTYGCEILEMTDARQKDKLLSWFYNIQLKEILSIFGSASEAGSLENIGRRYIFFDNVLSNFSGKYSTVFPSNWMVDVELSKLFCELTKQDIATQLSSHKVSSSIILDSLTHTLAFEKQLNAKFESSSFSGVILSLFEPYLSTWVNDQDSTIQAKFLEFLLREKLPAEIVKATTTADLMHLLQVNSVPNFAESSVELFKLFQKSLTQSTRLSSGEILVDLSKVFAKYLQRYHSTVLLPVLKLALEHSQGIEPIKYLTMLINTADYVIKNSNDLQDKVSNMVLEKYRNEISFETQRSLYFELIGGAIIALVLKVTSDLSFLWRQFENKSWDSIESVSEVSNYMEEIIRILSDDHRLICPLIIRESYVRNYADKLIDQIISDVMERLKVIKPLSILAIEQLMLDVSKVKAFLEKVPLYSDPNFDSQKPIQDKDSQSPKSYLRHLQLKFSRLETLLKLLLTPALPVDNIVESYLTMIGDQSTSNLKKVLDLKGIPSLEQAKYVENFKLQLTMRSDLLVESPIMAGLGDFTAIEAGSHPSSQEQPGEVDVRELVNSKSPEPNIPDFLKNNSAKIQALKLNNAFKDFSINGENHVNKFNENFKNFGKFFRKDNSEGP